MKLKFVICLAFFCTTLYFPSFAQEGKIDSTNIVTLSIDPQSARGATVSQIFDEVKFVPLEITKESLFGQISQFKTIDNLYLIFDSDTEAILIFNLDGKYITKINGSKLESSKDDKEKVQLYGFTTVKENNQQYIAIFTPNNVQWFNLAGKFVKKGKNFDYNNDIKFKEGNTSVKQYTYLKSGKDSTLYRFSIKTQKPLDSVYVSSPKNSTVLN